MTAWDRAETAGLETDMGTEWQLEQLKKRFPDFCAGKQGHFYAFFGGKYAGKTRLFETLHCLFPPKPGDVVYDPRSVLVDLGIAGSLSSPQDFFKYLFRKMREQLGICSIGQETDFLFEDERRALVDFRQAFLLLVSAIEPRSTRIVLLLNDADALMGYPFAPVLFTHLVQLYGDLDFIRSVTAQLDTVMAGGPLLYNHLLNTRFAEEPAYWYNLEALPPEIAKLVVHKELSTIQDRPDLVDRILSNTGGHPYLLQHFTASLVALAQGGEKLTADVVERVAQDCLESLGDPLDWFQECSEAIGAQGARPIYAALLTGKAMTWPDIKAVILERQLGDLSSLRGSAPVFRALDALLFHGLVRCDGDPRESRSRFTITSNLFRQWFLDNVLLPHERARVESEKMIGAPAEGYDVGIIRKLLKDAFNAKDLVRFCADRSIFRPILDKFGLDFSFEEMIDVVIEYCRTQRLFPELLETVREVSPRQYQRYYSDS